MIRKMLIIFVTTIVVSSLVLTSTAIVSLASELDTTTIKPDVYKMIVMKMLTAIEGLVE